MVGRTVGRTDRRVYGRSGGWMFWRMGGRNGGWVGGRMDGRGMAGRTDSQADWRLIHEFEKVEHGTDIHNPFSYPFLLKTREGNFHLVYTWKRQYIRHVYFNNAALQQMLQLTGPDS